MRPVLILCLGLCVTLALAPGAHALPLLPTASCGSTAPDATSCSTGTHVVVLHAELDVLAGDDYSGTIVNRLVSETGELGRACTYEAGEVKMCITWGSGFVAGAEVQHACGSYDDSRTTVPGGRGAFTCTVTGTLQAPA